jgi:hypothetical protein
LVRRPSAWLRRNEIEIGLDGAVQSVRVSCIPRETKQGGDLYPLGLANDGPVDYFRAGSLERGTNHAQHSLRNPLSNCTAH